MLRTLLVTLIGSGYTVLALPFAILYALLTRDPACMYAVARQGFQLALALGGIRVKVEGHRLENANSTYLFVSNHQSYCDPAALFLALPHYDLRFMVKKELGRVPLLNLGMWLAGYVFVDRASGFKARRSMTLAAKRLQSGHSFLVFPEGTRSRSGKLGTFKRGTFQLALEAGVPILPVTVVGSYELLPPWKFRVHPGVIRVVLHPPIETRQLAPADLRPLMKQVREVIATALPADDIETEVGEQEVEE
jgi:1-acyl-sn-glycerol-3-phosphate acyltransferase